MVKSSTFDAQARGERAVSEVMLGRVVARNSPARLSKAKAKTMLREGEARGHPLTEKQRGLFGLIASGKRPSKRKGYKG